MGSSTLQTLQEPILLTYLLGRRVLSRRYPADPVGIQKSAATV
jgi:hypothetical protein